MDTTSIQDLWQKLDDQKLPENRLFYELSGLRDDDLLQLTSRWETLPISLQRQIVSKAKDITEVDFTVDFSAVFYLGVKSVDDYVCVIALEGLIDTEDVRLLPKLFSLVQNSSSIEIRQAAASLLGAFVLLGELEKIPSHKFAQIVTTLINIYKQPDESVQVKRRALESLSYTGTHSVSEMIQQAYENPDADDKMLASAVFSMGRNADKRWADIVTKELINPHPEIRFEATRACGELQLKEAVQDIIDLTDDADIEVAQMALWSLGQIGGSRARKTLESYLTSDSESLSEAAEQALSELEFFENGISSFLGPPSEFNGEGEESWLTPEGFVTGGNNPNDDDDDSHDSGYDNDSTYTNGNGTID